MNSRYSHFKVDPGIFKAYDIRGLYPEQISPAVAYFIGRAFVKFLNKKSPRIAVGRDNRLSSDILFKALSQGLRDEGGQAVNIGLSPTPLLYFSAAHFNLDGGINITASHNPAQYNGFKLVREKAIPISGRSGLMDIKKIIEQNKFSQNKKGGSSRRNTVKAYLDFNLRGIDFSGLNELKLVVDTANAVPGILIDRLARETGLKIKHLFARLDGSFPNHEPDPLKKENLRQICRVVRQTKADLGVAFDGDGDRIVFIDEKGQPIAGHFITALMAGLILKDSPGEKILYDVRSGNIIKEVVEEAGGRALIGKIGHSLIKERMRKEKIIFSGEFSGHYYHRDHYFSECPLLVLFQVLLLLSSANKPLSGLIKELSKYHHSGEINFKTANKNKILKRLAAEFKKGKATKIDGLRIDFDDWWFLVRPSNTEPVIRLVVEAKQKKLMDEKIRQITSLIQNP